MASGRHGGRELLAYMSAGLPFDAAHVAGNVAFALAFGPALLAALRRFRARMHVTWVPLAAALALALLAAPALAAVPRAPLRYVERAQNADGGFGAAPGQSSSALYSGWAALGLEASGRDSSALRHAVAYLARNARQVRDPGAIERTILVLAAAGESPRRFAGRDLVAELLRRRRRDGSIAGQVNLTAFGVLALRAARSADAAVRRAAAWLTAQQHPDGGFNFAGRGGPSGVDDTSAPLQALVAAGRRSSAAVRRATAFLMRAQRPDGGFPLTPGDASNAQSTAWAVQGLVAGARNPATLRRDGSRTPLQYLASLTAPGGAVRYSRTSAQTPVWVTSQALLAFARRPLPLPRVARAAVAAATPAPAPTATATPAPTATPRPIAHAAAAAPSAAALRPVARGLGALVALLAAAY
jgi:prenyltransferase beta subunit